MGAWAIIPVKSLSESKRRLAHVLSPEQRAMLMRNLLSHVLSVVKQTPQISKTLVVSADPVVWSIAELLGVEVVEEVSPPDLNSAASLGLQLAMAGGAQGALFLPADLPFASSADIGLIIGEDVNDVSGRGLKVGLGYPVDGTPFAGSEQPMMSICSDRQVAGTNALFLRPPAAFEFHFGLNSLQRHIREALERDYLVRLVNSPGLQFDLDTGEDWRALQADDRDKLADTSATQRLIY